MLKGRLTATTVVKAVLAVAVLALALDLRLTAIQQTRVVTPIRADAKDYFFYARNLVEHGVYSRADTRVRSGDLRPDFLRPPGFPLFATLYYDPDPFSFVERVKVTQALLNAASVLGVFLVGCWMLGYWPGLLAAALYAVSPHVIVSNVYFLTESLTATLIVALMGSLAAGLRTGRWYWWLIAGLVLGYTALTRPYVTYFPLFVIPYVLWQYGRGYWRHAAAFAVGFALLVVPLKVVVSRDGGTDSAGLMRGTIHHGMYPDLKYRDDPRSFGFPYRFDPRGAEIAKDMDTLLGELRTRFTDEPGRHLYWFLVGKPLRMWQWSIIQGVRDIYVYPVRESPYDSVPRFEFTLQLSHWAHVPAVILGAAACVLVWLPWARRFFDGGPLVMLRILSLLLVYATLVHMVGAPFPRYQVPQKAPLFLMAAAVLTMLARAAWRRGAAPARAEGAAGA